MTVPEEPTTPPVEISAPGGTVRSRNPFAVRDEPTEFSGDPLQTRDAYAPLAGETREERPPAHLRDALTGRNGRRLS
ncbi:hypothetical protein ACFUIZ_14855 [Streptomyces cinereoruber]|uniref:hypothetical protein n=1 Tax=Streptomyces cinereoruber TaxID=67260 RepID=UPI003637A4A6